MKNYLLIMLLIFLFLSSKVYGKESTYFIQGLKHFKMKEFDKSKFFFERDLVFNPKSEKSYLYLAKIFMEKENLEEEEINLKKVLLLNPQNEEAIYLLALIKIEQSDYNETEALINKFSLICKSLCSKKMK